MSKSRSSNRGQWQGNTRWRQGWSGAGKGCDDSSASVSPLQNPEQLSDERVATALCTMQDHVQQVTVMTHRRCRQNALRAHSLEKKEIRLTGAMEALTSARSPGRREVHPWPKEQRGSRGRDNSHECLAGHLWKGRRAREAR